MIAAPLLLLCHSFFAEAPDPCPVPQLGSAPQIDGRYEPLWEECPEVKLERPGFEGPVSLRAAVNGDRVYLVLRFPCKEPMTKHKPWLWNAAERRFVVGPEREDSLCIRLLQSERPGAVTCDTWYWGACRLSEGAADDLLQVFSLEEPAQSLKSVAPDGTPHFLVSTPDEGLRPWSGNYDVKTLHLNPNRYEALPPTGSRMDVKCKGEWKEGFWTVEFSRALDTVQTDDLRLVPGSLLQLDVVRTMESPPGPLAPGGDRSRLLRLRFPEAPQP
ncbi:MAG: hypothetical protein RL095_1503 [Verrucomicrobiota bacterium]|jgi:hypothetical protein